MDPEHVTICLIHDAVQPGAAVTEPVRFGLQDVNGEVYAGDVVDGDGVDGAGCQRFEAVLRLADKGGVPILSGPFCHGPPTARFLYLSWKREGAHAAPWAWRIKMPLSGLDWPTLEAAGAPGFCLEADVRGRRPHTSAPVAWQVTALHRGAP